MAQQGEQKQRIPGRPKDTVNEENTRREEQPDAAMERGERHETGKTIARGGKSEKDAED